VFVSEPGKVLIMDKRWFRKLLDRPKSRRLETTQTRADEGVAEAQFSLGFNFANTGRMVPDYAQAARWYLLAANQNHAMAQFNLGIMFAEGQGVPRDDAQSEKWMRRAAQQGDAGAQHNMGSRHRRASFKAPLADELESNLVAYKWFSLAAAQDYRGSDMAFESVALGLTPDQVAEGDHRAAAFTVASSNPIKV
jgi:TPR repeat protein